MLPTASEKHHDAIVSRVVVINREEDDEFSRPLAEERTEGASRAFRKSQIVAQPLVRLRVLSSLTVAL